SDAAKRSSPSTSTATLVHPDRRRVGAAVNHAKDPSSSPARSLGEESPDPVDESLAGQPITRNHIAQILFTSGTTGEPRGVVLTHGNFLANLEPLERGIDPYRKYEKWFHPLRFVSLVPLSHVFGQFMALFVPPLLGAAVVFENSANAIAKPRKASTTLRARKRRKPSNPPKPNPGSTRPSSPPKTKNSSTAPGFSAASIAASAGNSGPSSLEAPRSLPTPKNSSNASA